MMRYCLVLLFLSVVLSSAPAQKNLSGADFFELMNSGGERVIFDVRIYEKYFEDRIPGAIYAGKKDVLFNVLGEMERSNIVLVYCEIGKRSLEVMKILKEEGFENVFHLEGGYKDWKENGFPVDSMMMN